MSNQKTTVGQTGEDVAVKFLEQNGYTVLERNYRSGHQEIDIIARDHEFLIFVEVKTRSCHIPERMNYGRPACAVGSAKQRNIVLAAQSYLRKHPENTLQPRMDVIEIYLKKTVEGAPPSLLNVHHIRNAFLAK